MGRVETNAKKRKRLSEAKAALNGTSSTPPTVDTSKPTAVFQPRKGRDWTVSVALPGSIIANAQTHDLRTTLAGQIARALSVFCIDEIVVFSDGNTAKRHRQSQSQSQVPETPPSQDEYTGTSDPDHFLVHLLSYLETPPHLRKLLFPIHPNLRTAGTLPSLDLPHHLRSDEWCTYREGVTLSSSHNTNTNTANPGTLVEAGLRIPITVPDPIPPATRVTVKFPLGSEEANRDKEGTNPAIQAEAVNPDEPREEEGYYWGFKVRRAGSLSAVFEECEFEGGYDFSIGTSERGRPLEELYAASDHPSSKSSHNTVGTSNGRISHNGGEASSPSSDPQDDFSVPAKFSHLLICLGGVAGLETAVKNDPKLKELGVVDASKVFDRWVDICPGQGSRTIRTEEALWISLMGLRRLVEGNLST